MSPKALQVSRKIRDYIDQVVSPLGDADYVEVLEDVSSICDMKVEAKREETGDED